MVLFTKTGLMWGFVFAFLVAVGFVLRRTATMCVFQPQPLSWETSGGKLTGHGLLLERGFNEVTVFLNGNAGQACEGLDTLQQCQSFRHTDLLAIEYPGYGHTLNTESPTFQGCAQKTRDAILTLARTHDKIHLVGQSIGTMVMALAVKDLPAQVFRKIHRIILITPFDSLFRVANHAVPLMGPLGLSLAYPTIPSPQQCWETVGQQLREYEIPVTLFLATEDEITPHYTGVSLYNFFAQSQCLVRRHDIPTGHNEIMCNILRDGLL